METSCAAGEVNLVAGYEPDALPGCPPRAKGEPALRRMRSRTRSLSSWLDVNQEFSKLAEGFG
jgi:hypothetical protein